MLTYAKTLNNNRVHERVVNEKPLLFKKDRGAHLKYVKDNVTKLLDNSVGKCNVLYEENERHFIPYPTLKHEGGSIVVWAWISARTSILVRTACHL